MQLTIILKTTIQKITTKTEKLRCVSQRTLISYKAKRLHKIDVEKIKNLLNSKIYTELISDGVASLIERIHQESNNVKVIEIISEIRTKIAIDDKTYKKNWELADKIRVACDKEGIVLKDSKDDTVWELKE